MMLTLEVTKEPIRLPHIWTKHEHCTNPGTCMICDGGLALCTICGGLEGALLDGCPGIRLTVDQHEWNYRKFLTFRGDGPAVHRRFVPKMKAR